MSTDGPVCFRGSKAVGCRHDSWVTGDGKGSSETTGLTGVNMLPAISGGPWTERETPPLGRPLCGTLLSEFTNRFNRRSAANALPSTPARTPTGLCRRAASLRERFLSNVVPCAT